MSPRSADLACLALLAVALVTFAVQGVVDSESGDLREVHDYAITHAMSRELVDSGAYRPDFPYPLPFVAMKLALAAPGVAISGLVWVAGMLAAAGAAVAAFVALLAPSLRRRALPAVLLAFGAAVYGIQWDFRSVNANTVFLALLLWSRVFSLRGRAGRAGCLLAASISLKLLSIALLPYLLLRGRRRELAASLAWLVAFFALIPALAFGPANALHLTGSWLSTLAASAGPEYPLELVAYQVSLYHTLLVFLAERSPEPALRLASFPLTAVFLLARGLQLLVAGGIFAFLAWVRRRGSPRPEGVRELIETGLLLLAMLLLSPVLEPHHAAILWLPATALAAVALDPAGPPGPRRLALAVLGASALALLAAPSGAGKGVAVNATLLGYAAALLTCHQR